MEDKEIVKLFLEMQEWQSFECKRAAIDPSKLLETAIAFANTEGGRIFIGVDDHGKVKGIQITNKLKSEIQDLARGAILLL